MTEHHIVRVALGGGWLRQFAFGTLEHDDIAIGAHGKVCIGRHHVVLADIATNGVVRLGRASNGLVGLEGELGLVDMDTTCGERMVRHICVVITSESADVHVAHDGHISSHCNCLITADNIATNRTGRWINALDGGISKGMGHPHCVGGLLSGLALLIEGEGLLADDNASWVAD